MQIKKQTLDQMLACPAVPPESGGIIGQKENVICVFKFDRGTPTYDKAVYTPNVEDLNRQISEWMSLGIMFCGIAHSHPADQETLSPEDRYNIKVIFDAMPPYITELYFPIILPGIKMISYKAIRTGSTVDIRKDTLTIIK